MCVVTRCGSQPRWVARKRSRAFDLNSTHMGGRLSPCYACSRRCSPRRSSLASSRAATIAGPGMTIAIRSCAAAGRSATTGATDSGATRRAGISAGTIATRIRDRRSTPSHARTRALRPLLRRHLTVERASREARASCARAARRMPIARRALSASLPAVLDRTLRRRRTQAQSRALRSAVRAARRAPIVPRALRVRRSARAASACPPRAAANSLQKLSETFGSPLRERRGRRHAS